MTEISTKRRRLRRRPTTAENQLPPNWRDQLAAETRARSASSVSREYRAAQAEANALPTTPLVQTPFVVALSALHMLRAIAKREGVSVQSLIREAVSELIRLRTTSSNASSKKRAKKKEKTRTRKSSRRATDSEE